MWDERGYDEGYELDNPKHSTFRERYADAADDARKRDRENGIPNPFVEQWKEAQKVEAAWLGACDYSGCIMPVGHAGGHFVEAR